MLRIFVCISLSGIVAWTGPKKLMAPVTSEPGAVAISYNLDSTLILSEVNKVRKKGCSCGNKKMPAVAPVSWNSLLAQAAADHSKDMHTNNFFSHESKKGSPGQRIKKAGYQWSAYGENLAYDNTDEKGVVEGWLGSPDHCRTLMSPLFKEMGAGRSGPYWTMDFGLK
jgi:uncharacterized protein YkwD